MADPDEALIEAIAEAIGTVATDHRSCTSNPANGARTCTCGAVLLRWNDWARHGLDETARAAYAAMVEHLGLVEETRTLDDGVAGVTVGDASGLRQVWSIPNTIQRRLVSRWTEVDHD